MAFTFSIADGIAFGAIAFVTLNLAAGRRQQIGWPVALICPGVCAQGMCWLRPRGSARTNPARRSLHAPVLSTVRLARIVR